MVQTWVQKIDSASAIQQINHHPADSTVRFVGSYSLDSDFSGR